MGRFIEGVPFVIRVLLLEMRQGPCARVLKVRSATDVRSNGRLNSLSQAPVGFDVVPANYDVFSHFPAVDRDGEIDLWPANHCARCPGSQLRLVDSRLRRL